MYANCHVIKIFYMHNSFSAPSPAFEGSVAKLLWEAEALRPRPTSSTCMTDLPTTPT